MNSGGKQGTSRGKRENPGNEVGSFYLLSLMYVLFMRCFQGILPFVLFITLCSPYVGK